MRFKINLMIVTLLGLFSLCNTQTLSSMNIVLSSTCNSTSYKVGDLCSFTLKIGVPAGNSTNLYVEVFTSDLYTTYAQLCKPTIAVDTVAFSTLASNLPQVQMISDFMSKSQFDRAVIDFGTITNANTVNASFITISFNAVIIANNLTSGSEIWITAGAEYFSGTEVWVGQMSLNYTISSATETNVTSGTLLNSTSSVEIGKTGFFTYSVNVTKLRYFTLSAMAISNSPHVSVCTIHVQSADFCYQCLDSVKAYLTSTYDTNTSSANLDLGYVPNSGFNLNNLATVIRFYVTYRLLDTANVSSTHSVSIKLKIGSAVVTGNHSLTAIAAVAETVAPVPTVTSSISKSIVGLYEPFYLRIKVQIPTSFNNLLKLDVVGNTTDGTARMKICYINVSFTGENVPCSNCLNLTSQTSYSATPLTKAYDRITWQVKSIKNNQLRTLTENNTANDIVFDVYGQLIANSLNGINSNISILACVTYGSQSLWISETFFGIGPTNYTTDNSSMPTFNIDYADSIGSSAADVYKTRLVYFDIFTKPGTVYQPLTVEIVMPETVLGNNIPAATVCRVKVLSVGKYASCVQPGVINYDANGYVTYLSRMIRWKNDKALVDLGSVCNIATTQTNDEDGKIRLLLYIQLEDDPTAVTTNYIGVGVQYTSTEIFVGQIALNKSATPVYTAGTPVHTYFDTLNTNATILAGTHGIANLVLKVPPNTKSLYNFQTVLTSSLTNGSASFCTLLYTNKGENVPCNGLIKHNYDYSTGTAIYYKNSDFVYAGVLCNINSSSAYNTNDVWDDNSVNIEITTRTSNEATGSYSLTFNVFDGLNNNSLSSKTFTWTVLPNALPAQNFTITNTTNVTFVSLDLNQNTTVPNTIFYKGQTSILRYVLFLNESKSFDLSLTINSTLGLDTFEIQKFFITSVGDNLPCTASKYQPASFLKGMNYSYSATLPIGPFCYFPIDPTNSTASTLVVEAYVRIPITSPLSINQAATFTMHAFLNGIKSTTLTKTISGFVGDPASLIVPLINQNITLVTNTTNTNLTIHNNYTFTSYLNIPAFTSSRVKYRFEALNFNGTKSQFGHILSANITSVGRNVDGFANDFYTFKTITTNYSKSSGSLFYTDTVEFDLGIVTNTLYGQKIDNYNSNFDDVIVFSIVVMVTDNTFSNHLTLINAPTTAILGSNDVPQKNSYTQLVIQRSGLEKPILNMQTSMSNPMAIYYLNSTINVNFSVEHNQTTTAEAHFVTIRFFIPPYVTVKNSSIALSSKLVPNTADNTMLIFNAPILYFGEFLGGSLSLLVDSSKTFANTIQRYGSAPSAIEIPYTVEYQKFARTQPAPGDINGTIYQTPFASLSYLPEPITVVFYNVTSLRSIINPCQISASVNGHMAPTVFTTGWKTDFRTSQWYESNSNFLSIAFGNLTAVSKITLRQFLSTPTTTPFVKFRISYSNDNISFAYLPEDAYPVTTIPSPYTYVLPNGGVECRYLRIHITSIETPANLASKTTGFVLDDITGAVIEKNSSLTNVCPGTSTKVLPEFVPRSVLYIPNNSTVYACNEVGKKNQPMCYKSNNVNPVAWTILPPTVSTIVFWTFDVELFSERLYGVSNNKNVYVRSDDGGITWKSISGTEFTNAQNAAITNTQKFIYSYYSPLPSSAITSLTSSVPWAADPTGVYFNSQNVFDWFN